MTRRNDRGSFENTRSHLRLRHHDRSVSRSVPAVRFLQVRLQEHVRAVERGAQGDSYAGTPDEGYTGVRLVVRGDGARVQAAEAVQERAENA